MATPAAVPTVQDIPDKPHQPSASYKFPKRTFGQKKPVSRSFQPAWFSQWPFLHYNEANDVAYCHTCLLAFKISNHNVDPAFVSVLFNQKSFFHTNIITGDQRIQQLEGWIAFRNHEKSASHREAVKVIVTLPSTTRDIVEQLSQQHAAQKLKNRQALYQILSLIRFLGRQGLAVRGDGNELDGNFQQLLLMKAEDDPNLAEWLQRKENVYTSPAIQNEIIKVTSRALPSLR